MKTSFDITAEERRQLLRWALIKDRVDMWNDKGAFKAGEAAAYIFKLGLETAMKNLS